MFDRVFSIVFDGLTRHKWYFVAFLFVSALASGLSLGSISLDNNIELMLPKNAEIRRSLDFLRESDLTDKVVISLGLSSPDRSLQDLLGAARQLEEQLGPPLVTEVVSGLPVTDMVGELTSFVKVLPLLFDEAALARLDAQISPEGVDATMRRNYRQLVTPASSLTMSFIRTDPLGISFEFLRTLQDLSSFIDYQVEVVEGRFVSRDRAHSMLIVETPIAVADVSGAGRLVSYLRAEIEKLPAYISAAIIGGHLHTISNEKVIKADIWLTLSIAGIGFLLLFLLLFRDIRAVLLFLIPLFSVLLAISISSVVLSRLSHFIIGMGGVIAGIAVDYGIHVYMAIRSQGGRAEAVKLVAKPVVTGALTTLGVFAAFIFSSVQGYHQLAFFSILSILLCLVCSLFLLPHWLAGREPLQSEGAVWRSLSGRVRAYGGLIIVGWVVAMGAASLSCRNLEFSSDVTELDGSEHHVLQAEEDFRHIWGGGDPGAIFVVPGESRELALRNNALVYRDVVSALGERDFASLAAVWPLEEVAAENSARWRKFWRQGREARLRRLIAEHSAVYGFAREAFAPFFSNLYVELPPDEGPESLELFARLEERFVQETHNGYQVLSFLPDEDELVSELAELSRRHPGSFLVSRTAVARAISEAISSEIVYLSAVAALLIPGLAFLLLRDLRLTLLALVPVVSGVLAILGLIPLLGLSLNAPGVIAAMVVVGLCIDYGIFMVYACHHELETGTEMAVTLSAATTLLGTGVLLFAKHPVLFSVGVTMVIGVFAGYVSAMLVVPSLHRYWVGDAGQPR